MVCVRAEYMGESLYWYVNVLRVIEAIHGHKTYRTCVTQTNKATMEEISGDGFRTDETPMFLFIICRAIYYMHMHI